MSVSKILKPEYIPNVFINHETIVRLLELPWLSVTEARREYFMSDEPRSYTYGKGAGERSYDSAPFADPVIGIQMALNMPRYGSRSLDYNVCFLNRYDTQKNHLGWHADDSPFMDPYHPIAVVSFGCEREIWWKLQAESGVVPPENRQRLGNGSVFIMPAGFQDSYYHRIPKADRECGVRVSLTFRRYVEAAK